LLFYTLSLHDALPIFVSDLKLPHSSGGIGEAKGEKTAMRGYSLRSGLPILAILLLAGAARAESTGETLRFAVMRDGQQIGSTTIDRKSTRLNSSHVKI